jgi:EAL domain-containing protein (putative c-di-GMP-specific phosphodiesterase class I)
MVGCEALVRWNHPELGLIPPAEFIGHAEESGLIMPLGEWVLATACKLNKRWQSEGLRCMPVSVNLSARQFREMGIVDTIERTLQSTGLSARCLMIEITESCAMKDVDYTISMLESLKQMGVQIALDDFGTGYSSLSYLKRLPIDLLKIDKSFVVEVPGDVEDASIISAIVGLAHNLGMQVVAEGVEAKDQLHFLRSINCDYMQGFYFSTPLDEENFVLLLESDKRLQLDEHAAKVPEVRIV